MAKKRSWARRGKNVNRQNTLGRVTNRWTFPACWKWITDTCAWSGGGSCMVFPLWRHSPRFPLLSFCILGSEAERQLTVQVLGNVSKERYARVRSKAVYWKYRFNFDVISILWLFRCIFLTYWCLWEFWGIFWYNFQKINKKGIREFKIENVNIDWIWDFKTSTMRAGEIFSLFTFLDSKKIEIMIFLGQNIAFPLLLAW